MCRFIPLAGAIAMYVSGLISGVLIGAHHGDDRTPAQRCADRLGISYDARDGATEHLTAFRRCVAAGSVTREGYRCFAEANPVLPEGVEIIAYPLPDREPHKVAGVLVACP